MRERRKSLSGMILVILLLTFTTIGTINVDMASGEVLPEIYVDPPTSTATPTETFAVDINIVNIRAEESLYGWEFDIGFNTTLLDAVDVVEGPFLKDTGYSTLFKKKINNTAGTVKALDLIAVFPAPPQGAVGNGILCTITFLVEAEGADPLHFEYTELSTIIGTNTYPIEHTAEDGYFDNSPPTTQYDLTISVDGSGATVPAVGVHTYDADTLVPVTATPSGGWLFDHWELDSVDVGTDNPYTVTMDDDYALTAFFTETVGDITPPTITINEPVTGDYLHSETITLDFSAGDAESGVASISATLNGDTVDSGDSIELFMLSLGTHTLTVTAVDNAGNPATETVDFNIIATISSLQDLVTMFFESGYFHSPKGMYTSFIKKLYTAEAKIDAGQISAAKGVLGAFINHAEAQSGKHLDEYTANILIADAKYVINNL